MAYLMTDMAEGGKAALQLQQTMAAAPDVQQAQANVMQEQQLKLQREQASADHTKLSNLMEDAGWQADKEATAKMVTWVKDNPKATPLEQLKAAAGFKMEVGRTIEGAKIDEQITNMEAKQLASEIKKTAENHELINNARSVLSAVRGDPARLDAFAKDLPPQQVAAIKAEIGPNWDKMTSNEKLDSLDGLMHNAQRQLVQRTIDAGLKKNADNITSKEKIAENQNKALIRGKEITASGKGGKGGNDQLVDIKKFGEAWKVINGQYEEKLEPKRNALRDATAEFEKATKYMGLKSLDATNKDDMATPAGKKVLKAQKELSQVEYEKFSRGYEIAKSMKDGPARDAQLKEMGQSMLRNLDGVDDPKAIAEARKKANPDLKVGKLATNENDPKPVPSNKPAQESKVVSQADIQETAKKSGKTIEEVKAAIKAKGWKVKD